MLSHLRRLQNAWVRDELQIDNDTLPDDVTYIPSRQRNATAACFNAQQHGPYVIGLDACLCKCLTTDLCTRLDTGMPWGSTRLRSAPAASRGSVS